MEIMSPRIALKDMLLRTSAVATTRNATFYGDARLPIFERVPANMKLRPRLLQSSAQAIWSLAARWLSRSVWDRVFKLQLEARIKHDLEVEMPIMQRMARWAAMAISRLRVG